VVPDSTAGKAVRLANTVAPSLVLIVTGAPASGKTMLGPPLARALGLPYLSKDRFKEALFDTLGYSERAWSQRLGAACMRLLFDTTATLLEAGQSLAVEANFWPKLSTPEFQSLAERYGCRFIPHSALRAFPVRRRQGRCHNQDRCRRTSVRCSSNQAVPSGSS
jgi:predicted kinase